MFAKLNVLNRITWLGYNVRNYLFLDDSELFHVTSMQYKFSFIFVLCLNDKIICCIVFYSFLINQKRFSCTIYSKYYTLYFKHFLKSGIMPMCMDYSRTFLNFTEKLSFVSFNKPRVETRWTEMKTTLVLNLKLKKIWTFSMKRFLLGFWPFVQQKKNAENRKSYIFGNLGLLLGFFGCSRFQFFRID